MADKVSLLSVWASPFGMRVSIALDLKGVKYEYVEEDLGNKSQLLLKSNPAHKKIPVLIHNEKPVCESLIIVQYIDEVWKEKNPLLPRDPYQRYLARFWADFADKKVYDSGRNIWMTKGEKQETAKKELISCLKLLEDELGEKTFFGGENLGFLDVALVPYYSWFYAFETCGNFCIETHCPKLVAWAKRCLKIEAVAKSLPESKKVYEFVLQLQKKYGVE